MVEKFGKATRIGFAILAASLLFILTNFEEIIGRIFLSMLVVSFMLLVLDKKIEIKVERVKNRLKSFLLGTGGYLSFLVLSFIL